MALDLTYMAVAFDGVGLDASAVNGTLFALGIDTPSTVPSGWHWQTRALMDAPDVSADRIDPNTGEVSTSNIPVRLNPHPELRRLFGFLQSRATGALATALTDATTTTVVLSSSTSAEVIYLGREAIKLGTHTGGGTYTGCTRGYWSTQPSPHAAGTYFFIRVPYWRYREATLYRVADDGTIEARGTGYVEYRPVVGTQQITVDLLGVSTALRGTRLDPPGEINWYGKYVQVSATPKLIVPGGYPIDQEESRYKKANATHRFTRAFQVDDTLVSRYKRNQAYPFPLLGTPVDAERGDVIERVHEVALWSLEAEAEIKAYGLSALYHEIAPTHTAPFPFHPGTVIGAILLSGPSDAEDPDSYDLLAPGRGLDFGRFISSDELEAWRDVVASTGHIQIDQYQLGWNGESTPGYDDLRKMAYYYGFVLSTTREGLLCLRRMRPASVLTSAAAGSLTPLTGLFDLQVPRSSVLDSLRATVGGMPWEESVEVGTAIDNVEVGLGSEVRKYGAVQEATIDAPFVSAKKAEGIGRLELVARLAYRKLGIPEVTIRVNGPEVTGFSYTLGDWVKLTAHPTLETKLVTDADGELTATFSEDYWIGQLISRRPLHREADAHEVTLLLANYPIKALVRLRAPSMVLTGSSGTTLTGETDSDLGADTSDAETFNEGDQVEIWNAEGQPQGTGVRELVSVSEGELIVDSAFDVDPGAGQVVQLARAPDYSNATVVSGFTRPYVYLAEDGAIPEYAGRDIYG